MSDSEQLPLFDLGKAPPAAPPDQATPGLNHTTQIQDAIVIYLDALRLSGASIYTIKAFKSDILLLSRWTSPIKPIGQIGTDDLEKFLKWMSEERGKPCSPKTYARRVTALKNFFGFLKGQDAIPYDPSKAVIQQTVSSPLPVILRPDELQRVLDVTQRLRSGKEPDARPHLVVTLVLQTGIKKGEAVALKQSDVHREGPDTPFIWVRYENPRMRYKERKIRVTKELIEILDEYLRQRKPEGGVIFDCTARMLEYVLRDVAQQVKLPQKKVSFETLRWTCALRDYQDKMNPERLREKLGLSRISWRETSTKLAELASQLKG